MIRKLKYVMAWTLVALLTAFLIYCSVVSIANATVPDSGAVLIATMQDGDVNVYQIRYPGFDNCLVIVGQLHGKTVAGVCNQW
jgi:hypothetical protein